MSNSKGSTVSYGNNEAFPTHEDMVSFRPAALAFATKLNFKLDEGPQWSGLVENCATLALPCLATVGTCMEKSYR